MNKTQQMPKGLSRQIKAKVEFFNNSALADTFYSNTILKSVVIDRQGDESKFFGYGISQKAVITLIDLNRELDVAAYDSFKVYFDGGSGYVSAYPFFTQLEAEYYESSRSLTITGYDAITAAEEHLYEEIGIYASDMETLCERIAMLLDVNGYDIEDNDRFWHYFESINLEGKETLREVLDDIAEYTGTVYFIDYQNKLHFKLLDNQSIQEQISKTDYFSLSEGENYWLNTVAHTDELEDEVSYSQSDEGASQYLYENAFLETSDDIGYEVESLGEVVCGSARQNFDIQWRGNYLLEAADKIQIDGRIIGFIINDKIEYSGGLKEHTSYNIDNTSKAAANPTSLGEAIKQTYAKVDKANKEISIVAGDVKSFDSRISSIEMNTNSISASVSEIQKTTNEKIEGISEDTAELTKQVSAMITTEQVDLLISQAMSDGVNKVETATGYTFDESGLTITKTNSEISTTITDDGMKVKKSGSDVLIADNQGVKAKDLHATSYLIIGDNSRLENFGLRTACFWIGDV